MRTEPGAISPKGRFPDELHRRSTERSSGRSAESWYLRMGLLPGQRASPPRASLRSARQREHDLEHLPAPSAFLPLHTVLAWGARNAPNGSAVLRPGGRIGVSDVVADDDVSADERAERGNWVGCIAGALSRTEYETGLTAGGFADVHITFTHDFANGLHGAIVQAHKPEEQQ